MRICPLWSLLVPIADAALSELTLPTVRFADLAVADGVRARAALESLGALAIVDIPGFAAAREPLPPRRPPPASMLLRVGVGPTIRASGAEFSRPGDSAVGEPSLHTNGQRG